MKDDKKKYDFGGYATKVGLKCSDGRTIMQDAFQAQDGMTVPLVYQHLHSDPGNILGHAVLENRKDGVYANCSFNDGPAAQNAKAAVKHGDIKSLSIYANNLVEKSKNVIHGVICEVSLVLAGANPGAYIDNVSFQHANGMDEYESEDEVFINAHYGDNTVVLEHSLTDGNDDPDEETKEDPIAHAASKKDDEETLADVIKTMSEKQQMAMYALVTQAIDAEEEVQHSNIKGDQTMKTNVFDKDQKATKEKETKTLSHDQLSTIIKDGMRVGSLKEGFLMHAQDYGIEQLDFLMPDARSTSATPIFLKRDTGWVVKVFNAATHTPFSRIKTILADITGEEARARGYIKGKLKKEEVIVLLKRTTGPTTIYKKQKLDRDDIVDITDLEVVTWLKAEMRMMLDEELSRAALVGDGRSPASDDKIKEDCIRPIYSDNELYAPKFILPENTTTAQLIDQIVLARKEYKGSGNPTLFSTPDVVGDMLLLKDLNQRRIYNTITDLAAALRVSEIVEVPVLENVTRELTTGTNAGKFADLLGIIVNMKDYSIGADKGGSINMFDDFDIDYNQFKYLIETRCSGALTVPKSALIMEKLRTPGEEDEGGE